MTEAWKPSPPGWKLGRTVLITVALLTSLLLLASSHPSTSPHVASFLPSAPEWVPHPFSSPSSGAFPGMEHAAEVHSAATGELELGILRTYESPSTGSFAAARALRDNGYPSSVCRFENICVTAGSAINDNVAWVFGTEEDKALRGELARSIIKSCLNTGTQVGPPPPVEQGVVWVEEPTFLFTKAETGNHPAAWGKAWGAMMANVAWNWDFLTNASMPGSFDSNSWIQRAQLVGQGQYALNGWAEFYMHTALTAAYDSLPGHRSGAYFHPQTPLKSPLPTPPPLNYRNQDILVNKTTCYRRAWSAKLLPGYFAHERDAELFRSTALESLHLPWSAQHPCDVQDLKVLFLRRDRPVWNEAALLSILADSGFAQGNINIASISAATPFFTQAKLFYDADLVVSVHGSQLANIAYLTPASAVIELFPHKYFHGEPQKLGFKLRHMHQTLRDNPYPSTEVVARLGSVADQTNLKDYVKYDQDFPTEASCMASVPCRFVVQSQQHLVPSNTVVGPMMLTISELLTIFGYRTYDSYGRGRMRRLGVYASEDDFRKALDNVKGHFQSQPKCMLRR